MKKYYTYLVVHKATGAFYYGVKYSKKSDPKKFWQPGGYNTSSKLVKELLKQQGHDSFHAEIRRMFDDPFKAQAWEKTVLRKFINHPLCLNKSISGIVDSQKVANIAKIDFDGTGSSYDKRIRKAHETKSQIGEDGLTGYQRSGRLLSKTYKENPSILESIIQKSKQTMSQIGEDGLTGYQRSGQKRLGDNNSSNRPEVREKISNSVKEYYNSLSDEDIAEISRKASQISNERGLGDKHSKWMLENNPTTGSVWCNDGKKNLRVKEEKDIPEGFTLGRASFIIVRNEFTCPHCGRIGKGPNMKRYHFENCRERT